MLQQTQGYVLYEGDVTASDGHVYHVVVRDVGTYPAVGMSIVNMIKGGQLFGQQNKPIGM